MVFQKALIHHLPDPAKAFAEAKRLLAPGGTLIVQDRTMEDVRKPGSSEHLRGYFLRSFQNFWPLKNSVAPSRKLLLPLFARSGFLRYQRLN
ncbi:methyltransferase domain-containing protein [Brevibacterium sp. RIT803]|nr:methyltransferase domain-containing protein [Brevibacterium sp. RIT 803]